MFGKIKDMRDNMKTLKELQGKLSNVDMTSPEAMMESMGVDINEIEKMFNNQPVESTIERKVPVKYVNDSENKNPEYAYDSDSGFDLRSTEEIWVQANDRRLIPTGLRFDIPDGYEIQVRSKSGLALNQGLMVLNSPGTVDSGYQGEIKVIIFNTTKDRIKIEKGQKIAQAVICPVLNGKWVDLVKVESIQEKDRNDKGFGSTGL
jgi:dUTP pyrophosphatase